MSLALCRRSRLDVLCSDDGRHCPWSLGRIETSRYRSLYHTAVMPLLAVGLVPRLWMSALTPYGSIPSP